MSKFETALENPGAVFKFGLNAPYRSDSLQSAIEPIDKQLASKLLDNPTKLTYHISGGTAVRLSRLLTDVDEQPVDSFRFPEKGFVTLGQPYEEQFIDDIAEQFDSVIEDGYTNSGEYNGEVYKKQITSDDFDFSERIPEVYDLLNDEVSAAIRGYYGASFELNSIKAWRNYHVPPEVVQESEVFSNYWHCDDHTVDFLKLFVYLTDVTEDHGPFHVVSKEDSETLANRGSEHRIAEHDDGVADETVESLVNVMRFTGPKGSAALCGTPLNYHRAGVPAPGQHRDIVQLMFTVKP